MSLSYASDVDINGGAYTSDKYGAYVWSSGGTININDGTTVKGTTAGAFAQTTCCCNATINIKVGKVEGPIKTDGKDDFKALVEISGGEVVGEFDPEAAADIKISGGKFSNEPSAYLA